MQSIRFQSVRFVLAGLFVAAGLAVLGAVAQTPAAQVPAAPAGGLDPSKLPDVVGIHLGMTVPQALAIVKGKYPANSIVLKYAKFQNSTDAPWISRVDARIDAQGANATSGSDQVTVYFNAPPNPQVVVRVDRGVQIVPSTTIGNLEASLFQKYGPTLVQKTIHSNLSWEFDEQGKATPVPGSYICTSFNQPAPAGAGSPAQAAEIMLGPPWTPPIQSQIPGLVRGCSDLVNITTLLDPAPANPNQMVSALNVSMIDHAEDIRDYIATSKYAEAAATAAAAAAQKKLNQNAAPKL
jgi:hypothetical protein